MCVGGSLEAEWMNRLSVTFKWTNHALSCQFSYGTRPLVGARRVEDAVTGEHSENTFPTQKHIFFLFFGVNQMFKGLTI